MKKSAFTLAVALSAFSAWAQNITLPKDNNGVSYWTPIRITDGTDKTRFAIVDPQGRLIVFMDSTTIGGTVNSKQFGPWLAGVYPTTGTFQVAFSTTPKVDVSGSSVTAFQGNNFVVLGGSVPFTVIIGTEASVRIVGSTIALPIDLQFILDSVRLRVAQDISSGTWQIAIGTQGVVVGPGGGSVPTVSTRTVVEPGLSDIIFFSSRTLSVSTTGQAVSGPGGPSSAVNVVSTITQVYASIQAIPVSSTGTFTTNPISTQSVQYGGGTFIVGFGTRPEVAVSSLTSSSTTARMTAYQASGATFTVSVAGRVDTSSVSVHGLGKFDTSGSSISASISGNVSVGAYSSTAPAKESGNLITVPDMSRAIPRDITEYNNINLSPFPGAVVFVASNVWVDTFSLSLSTSEANLFIDYMNVNISSMNVGNTFSQAQQGATAAATDTGWAIHTAGVTSPAIHWHGGNPMMFFPSITVRAASDGGTFGNVTAWQLFYRSTSTTPSGP